MHRVKVETVEEDFMNQQFKLKKAALGSGLSPTKEVAADIALKQELGGAPCRSAVQRRCSERLKSKPLKRYDIYFNAQPRKKMKRLEEIDAIVEEEILSSGSKSNCSKKRRALSETDIGLFSVKHTKSSRSTKKSKKHASARSGNSSQQNATTRLASKKKKTGTVPLSEKNASKHASSRMSEVDEEQNKGATQNLRKKRISVGSYEQNYAEKLREDDETDEDWSIRSWQNKSRIEQQTDTGLCKISVDLDSIALKITKTDRQEDSFSVVDSLKMFSSCLGSCMTDEIEKQVEADGLCTEGKDGEGTHREERQYSLHCRLVEGWLSDWEQEDIDESRKASSNVDIATHFKCTLNKEWSFKEHEETEQQSIRQEGLKDKESRTSLPVESSVADEHSSILEGNTMEDVISIDKSKNASSNLTRVDIATHSKCTLNKEWSFKDHEETEQLNMSQEVLKDKENGTSLPVECSVADEHLNILEGTATDISPFITDVTVAQLEVTAIQPIDAESSMAPLEALAIYNKNSASEEPASAGTHHQQAVDGCSLDSGSSAIQCTGPAEEQSGTQRLHLQLVAEIPSEQASQDDQHNENVPDLCAQTDGLVLPTVKSEPAMSDYNLKGILKRGPGLCENACGCIECVSGRSRAERASKFSQQQMRDIEGVSVMLLKELKNTRALIKSKLLGDPNLEKSSELEEVRAVTSHALRTEEKAKSWIVRMARDCNRYCRIMDSRAVANSQRKIVFADEAGKQLNHIKLFNS